MGKYEKLIFQILRGTSDANMAFSDLIDLMLHFGFEMRMKGRYEIIIFWSDEDQPYVADVPELPGCMAHGDTYEFALANIKAVIDLWIETAREFNDPIPAPKGRRLAFA